MPRISARRLPFPDQLNNGLTDMPIIRAKNETVAIRRSLIDNPRLSWHARGLMIFIDAHPEIDVDIFTRDLGGSRENREAFRELLDLGYLVDDKA